MTKRGPPFLRAETRDGRTLVRVASLMGEMGRDFVERERVDVTPERIYRLDEVGQAHACLP